MAVIEATARIPDGRALFQDAPHVRTRSPVTRAHLRPAAADPSSAIVRSLIWRLMLPFGDAVQTRKFF